MRKNERILRIKGPAPKPRGGRWVAVAAIAFTVAVAALVVWAVMGPGPAESPPVAQPTQAPGALAAQPAGATNSAAAPDAAAMPINQAVMVTVELDFGSRVPGIAEALSQIERRQQPETGQGRVFAILDAYGEPTPDQKKLHLSMHLSTENPGIGALVFRPTGEVLWQSRVVRGTNTTAFTGKNLTILLDDGQGRSYMVDGAGNPPSILDARLRDTGELIRDFWPEDAVREVTFIYSACGCPVKAMVRRVGEVTVRAKELPVMFPDDPAVMTVIRRLMAW